MTVCRICSGVRYGSSIIQRRSSESTSATGRRPFAVSRAGWSSMPTVCFWLMTCPVEVRPVSTAVRCSRAEGASPASMSSMRGSNAGGRGFIPLLVSMLSSRCVTAIRLIGSCRRSRNARVRGRSAGRTRSKACRDATASQFLMRCTGSIAAFGRAATWSKASQAYPQTSETSGTAARNGTNSCGTSGTPRTSRTNSAAIS